MSELCHPLHLVSAQCRWVLGDSTAVTGQAGHNTPARMYTPALRRNPATDLE